MTNLISRMFDVSGQPQMAEGRLAAHDSVGTDIGDLFVVHHYAPPHPADGALELVGLDGEVSNLTLAALRALPSREITAVLECAGNGRGLRARRTPGNQFGLGLFGQLSWRGASLRDVLDIFGMSIVGAEQVEVTGRDEGVTMPENSFDRFGKGLPIGKALHPDTIVAWQVNGSEIPHDHGGPLRLVVPGWYGIWWVKWPSRIALRTEPFAGFWQRERYTYQDESGSVRSIVEEVLPRAVLVSPAAGSDVRDDVRLEILAWAGEHEVTKVEFSVDDGATWLDAAGTAAPSPWQWSSWTAALPSGLPRGLRRVAVRATDVVGRTQEWQPSDNRLGYGNNGIHVVELSITASPPSA